MASTPNWQTELQVKEWEKESEKEFTLGSAWYQFSQNVEEPEAYGQAKGMSTIPGSPILRKKTPSTGAYSCTVPWQGKDDGLGVGGPGTLEGSESTITMRQKQIFYNNWREAVSLEDESIDGDFSKFYKLGAQKTSILTTNAMEIMDWRCARALMRGADHLLTDTALGGWAKTSLGTAPVTASYPEKVWVDGHGWVTWNATDGTYGTAINTEVDDMTSSNVFQVDEASLVALLASRNLVPLKWNFKGMKVNYIAMVSDEVADQLNSATGNWAATFRDGGKRAEDNRAITGALGVWRDVLYIVNQRQPVWNVAGAGYNGSDESYLDFANPTQDAVTRVTMGAADAGTGTAEITMVLGKGALGHSQVHGSKFTSKKFDYDFNEGFAIHRKEGFQRMSFKRQNADTTQPVQQSFFSFLTATVNSY